jgi:DNA-binding HxlR family transcriptional regulator
VFPGFLILAGRCFAPWIATLRGETGRTVDVGSTKEHDYVLAFSVRTKTPSMTSDVELLKAVADQASLDVVWQLLNGPRRQRDLAVELGVSAVAVSRTLARLEKEGLVRRDGPRAAYDLTFPTQIRSLLEAATGLARQVATEAYEEARERDIALRKAGMAGGRDHDRTRAGA